VAARLKQLLSSFREATDAYALARLEFAMRHPRLPSPPIVRRLSEGAARRVGPGRWEAVEHQLEEALCYAQAFGEQRKRRPASDPAFMNLRRTVAELDRYARAVRVVMTVEERDEV
jgi:hypothetical protein